MSIHRSMVADGLLPRPASVMGISMTGFGVRVVDHAIIALTHLIAGNQMRKLV